MPVNAGDLNERVTLQHVTHGEDSVGEPVETWTDYAENAGRWAAVKSLASVEKLLAAGQDAQVTHSVFLRWDDSILHTDRVLWRGLILNVAQVLHDRVDGWTKLLCKRTET